MANSADNDGDDNLQPRQNNAKVDKRLADLGKKISKARGEEENSGPSNRSRSYAYAFRIASEMIAAPVVGGFIGWWIDKVSGTTPIFLLIFLVFGFAAGIRNIMRTAEEMQKNNENGRNGE